MDTIEHTKELTRRIFAAMNQRSPGLLQEHLGEDAVFDFPGAGRIQGKQKIIVFLKLLLRKYPRLEFTVEEILAQDDRACAVWTNQGHTNQGEPYENRGVTVVHLAGGEIVFISDYFKDTSFTRGA